MKQLQLLQSTSLRWLPDETVFSLAARFHRVSGATSTSHTCKLLFGDPRRGAEHALPYRLQYLADVTQGVLGSFEDIVQHHTIVPFFLPFLPSGASDEIIESLRTDRLHGLRTRLGFASSRFRSVHPLKACLSCMQQDLEKHQTTYWHRSHQVPGTWSCPEHACLLQHFAGKNLLAGRFAFKLPDAAILSPTLAHAAGSDTAAASLQMTRFISAYMASGPSTRMDFAVLPRTLPGPATKWEEALRTYRIHCAALRVLPGLDALPGGHEETVDTLSRLKRSFGIRSHPIHWMTALSALYPSFESFRLEYETAQETLAVPDHSKLSVSVGSRASSRPKDVFPQFPHYHDLVAKHQSARVGGAADKRTEAAYREEVRTAAQQRWLEVTKDYADAGIKYCRKMAPSEYAWLRRHCPAWLQSVNSMLR